jgi:hypothetical protein
MTDPTLVLAILARARSSHFPISYTYALGVLAVFVIGCIVIGYLWRPRA